jgi:hypothetical protein
VHDQPSDAHPCLCMLWLFHMLTVAPCNRHGAMIRCMRASGRPWPPWPAAVPQVCTFLRLRTCMLGSILLCPSRKGSTPPAANSILMAWTRFGTKAAGCCAGLQEKWQDAQFAARLPGTTNESALGLAEGPADSEMCVPAAAASSASDAKMHTLCVPLPVSQAG